MKFVSIENRNFFFELESCPDDSLVRNPAHYHDRYEIYFITEGSCDYFIDDRSYHLVSGDVVLIPEGIIHNTLYHSTGHTRMLIYCPSHQIPATVRPNFYLYRSQIAKAQIELIFKQIKNEYENLDAFSEEIILCYLRLLFFTIAKHPNEYKEQDALSGVVAKAITFLRNHFSQEITLDGVSKQLSVSSAHLSRLFKKELGIGFSQYLNHLRLQKAKHLLLQSNKNISEISDECGFTDSNYFSSKFKKIYNLSPIAFKKQNKPTGR